MKHYTLIYQLHQRQLICQYEKNLLNILKIWSLIWKRESIRKNRQKKPSTVAWRWGQFVAIPLSQIQRKQTFFQQKGYLSYQKWSRLNSKIRKLSDKLKDTYSITIGTNHPQYAEPPDPIIKCANCNRRPIQNCTSVYHMELCTVISDLIISRRPFSFIRRSKYRYPI